MTDEAKIKKALVVLSPDLIQPESPLKSALLARAVELAKATGCELELFHVCFDGGIYNQLTASRNVQEQLQAGLIDRDATLLSEIAVRLKQKGIKVHCDARWDHPRTDAILRKIAQSKPDVVMKQAREHSYVLGVTSNTDWDLARRSPANVWLVHEEKNEINRLVAAIGNRLTDDVDVTTGMDYEIVRTARSISNVFDASIYPVNAYQVPDVHATTSGFGAVAVPVAPLQDKMNTSRTDVVKRHDAAVKALTQLFLIKPEDVYVCEGDPNKVIPEIAEKVDADMIVLGASSIGRLERLVSKVTVEPVMAESACDVFVVRDPERVSVPDADAAPLRGIPKHDLERAIANPGETFNSPQDVATTKEISVELRKRILQAWEYDIRAQMTGENEGGPRSDIDVGILDDIRKARQALAKKNASKSDRAPRLSAAV